MPRPTPTPSYRRRAVLRAAAVGGLAGVAGCAGGASEPSPTPSTTATPTPASSPTATPGAGLAALNPEERFDFWAGSWTGRDGGAVTVYPLLVGRLLLDGYGPADDPVAIAMTHFDPAGEQWVRRFLDRRGRLVRLRGGLDDGAMVLRGERVGSDGATTAMRATWAPDEAGAVRHTLATGGEGDAGWTTTFDASYDRTGDAPAFSDPSAEAVPGSGTAVADRPPRRRFDFWVGEWDVSNGDRQVGDSVVQRRLDGHLVLEHWFGRSGGTGKSFNYYDPSADVWTQHWVAGNGAWLEMSGGFDDGAMRLVGEQVSPLGSVQGYGGTFTPHEDGSVEQVLETSSDGETWNVAFTGTYERSS